MEGSTLLHADSAFLRLILNLPNSKVSTTVFANNFQIIKQQRELNLIKFSLILA